MDRIDELMRACENGRLDHVRSFLKCSEPVDVDCTDDDGNTPLQVAAASGRKDVVAFLLLSGALVDKVNRCGWTPLMQAARQGNASVVDVLLGYGASVNAVDKLGTSALLCAVRSGVLSCIKMLVDNGASPSSPSTPELTPLMVAAQFGLNSIVKYLVDVGCDVNQTTKSAGLNALMFAASNGHKGTAQLLLESGANAKATNVCGKTALDIAITRGKKQVRCCLGDNTPSGKSDSYEQSETDIFEAVVNGNSASVRRILEECPYLANRSRKTDGATPLTLAAALGDLEAIELLLNCGALVDVRETDGGWTPLMQAVFHGRKDAAMLLLRSGADTSVRDRHGYCAFEIGTSVDGVDAELLRCLAPLYTHVSQTLSMSSLSVTDSEAKQKWWNQLGGYLQQLKFKIPKSRDRSSASDESGRAATSHPRLDSILSADERLFRMNTASPCRLARPSRSLKPVVLPLLSPYGEGARQRASPAVINLPERLSSGMPYAMSANHEDDIAECDDETSSTEKFDTTADLRDILESLSLGKYHPLFCDEEIDTVAFSLLSEKDLIDLGIDDADSRKRLRAAISQLRKGSSQVL